MKSYALILLYILLIFICNLSLILNDAEDNHSNIVVPTKIFALRNVSVPGYSHKLNSLKKVVNDLDTDTNKVLEPSVDVKLNIDLVKDEFASYGNEFTDIVPQESAVSKEIENDASLVTPLTDGSSVQLGGDITQNVLQPKENEINQTKDILLQSKNLIENHSDNDIQLDDSAVTELPIEVSPDNITQNKNEDIPSFSEWTQKRLEEVEKKEQVNSSTRLQFTNGKESDAKLRWKNYASLDCGAKVIASNPEAISPGAVLSSSSDEYKLNPCTTRIWFVVELCETIQTKKIDLANYELFSSSPKDFTVSVSDRYPTRDWSIVGKFTAKDERDIQSFDIDTNIFGKYIKIDIKSHYGSEHYCPLSLFRAYGTSVFEVLQKEDPAHINRNEDDGDDDDDDENDIIKNSEDSDNVNDSIITNVEREGDESHKNLFSSATDAVISMVKKAAEVLGNKVNNQTIKNAIRKSNDSLHNSLLNTCNTPSHVIYCKNCDETHFAQIYELISCKMAYITQLVKNNFIYEALSNSVICQNYDYEYKIGLSTSNNLFTDYVASFFPLRYIGAICNEIAIFENRGILNNTNEFSNATGNMEYIKHSKLKVTAPQVSKTLELDSLNTLDLSETVVNSSLETQNLERDISQINPTKPFTSDFEVSQTDVNSNEFSSQETNETLEENTTENVESFPSTKLFEQNTEHTPDVEHIPEALDVIDDHFEHFISELNPENIQNPSVTPSATSKNSPQAQKESIFLRLSNRIKTLERNMSLSSQYLEELSRRYKKQVEEIQNLLEKTVISLREESFKKDIRNKQLEDRLDNLTAIIESLVNERHQWHFTTWWLFSSIVFIIIVYFFCRKYPFFKPTSDIQENSEILCSKSINPMILQKKNRRPSDQALKILHRSAVNASQENTYTKQKKRKKKHTLKKSNSISNIKDGDVEYLELTTKCDDPDWVESTHDVIEDIPFVLEESDHSALETYPVENKINMESMENMSLPSNKIDTNSMSYSNDIKADLNIYSLSNKELNKNMEPVKKEKRSFKKLLKKVF